MKARTSTAIILLCGILTAPLAAEQVLMRNGQIYNGRIVNQTRTEVVLDTPAGRLVLRKSDIRRISYGATPEETAREEAAKREEERKRAEDKRLEEEKVKEQKRQAEQRLAEEAAKKQEADRQVELKKQQDAKEEARKREEAKKQQDASRNADELRRQEELRKAQESRRSEDKKKLTEEEIRAQIREEVKREVEAAEARRRAEEQRLREESGQRQITRTAALARSAVLPGWGQLYQGRKIGYFYGAAALGLAGISSHQDKVYHARQSSYKDSARTFLILTPFVTRIFGYAQDDFQASSVFFLGVDHNSNALTAYQRAAQRARFARGAFLGLYVWNLADVLIFHKNQTTSVGFSSGPDSFQVSVQHRF